MRVLGVDPGLTRCGLGVVDGVAGRQLSLVRTDVARTPSDADIGARLLGIEQEIEEWLAAFRPDAVAVERVFSQHNVRTVMGTAQAGAVAIVCAARRGLPLEEFLVAAREAGLGSVPGTAARILDDDVRARLAGGPDLPVSRWLEVIEAAHRAGLTSTSTMVFGHIETPEQQVAHLRTLATIQDRTGGFTEFIAMPFVPAAASLSAGSPAPTPAPGLVGADVPGPSWRQVRAVHAVARLMLHQRIGNIQAAWPKFGLDASADLLRSGANDLGGLLLDGRLAPDAGAEAGLVLTRDDIDRVARELGRPVWQRTTGYGKVVAGV